MKESVRQAIQKDPIFINLPEEEQKYILGLSARLRLSWQYSRQLVEAAADLHMWDEGPLHNQLDPIISDVADSLPAGKQRNARIMHRLRSELEYRRRQEIDYSDFTPQPPRGGKHIFIDTSGDRTKLLGKCPVAGEKTRCCNLLTLDAVRQCGYRCSYCSIQSFYDQQQIYFYSDLRARLEELSAELSPDETYHIGTGQSSDSLLFGNHQGLLDDLTWFADKHPQIILELKTKSDNISPLVENGRTIPNNLICTWSLNTQTIIEKEEHLTASLDQRLAAARCAADKGILVGFHIHPMLWYAGWEQEYKELFIRLQDAFSPDEVVMVSFGTLTFIRPVIQRLRCLGRKSKVLRIPLTDTSGKYSYPREIKLQLFSHAYSSFSSRWKQEVFFYLCMEPADIWKPVFSFEYKDNDTFERAMKAAYRHKIRNAQAR